MITLLTDFGWTHYVGQMKAVIQGIAPGEVVVDMSHDVRPGEVRQGAFQLWAALAHAPVGVHVGVVDPGVGTDRVGIVVETDRGPLVGPDNGLLMPAARRLGMGEVRVIANPDLCLEEPSSTFHGRDIFAPVAAHLAAGVPFEDVGPVLDDPVSLHLRAGTVEGVWHAEVLDVDRFGNLITSIPGGALEGAPGGVIGVDLGSAHEEVPLVGTFDDLGPGSLGALVGSSGLLELVVNQGSAQDATGLDIGDAVVVSLEGR